MFMYRKISGSIGSGSGATMCYTYAQKQVIHIHKERAQIPLQTIYLIIVYIVVTDNKYEYNDMSSTHVSSAYGMTLSLSPSQSLGV